MRLRWGSGIDSTERFPRVIKPDARITDIVQTLADPEEYVRRIVGSFVEHSFDKQRLQETGRRQNAPAAFARAP